MEKRYNDLNGYLRSVFGCRVQKISIDAGFSCPNRDGAISEKGCIFCNARGSGTGANAKGLSVTDQLMDGKAIKSLYDEALAVEGVVGLSIGTRPDCVDEPVLKLLQNYAEKYLVWIEYGMQSVHDSTLSVINRGHDFKCFQKAVDATKNRGIKICAHVILGLPNEKRSHMLETAKAVAKMEIDGIKIHLLYVVKGTELENLYRQGKYRCLEQKEYTDLVCDFLELIPQDMVIQRLTGDPHPEELVAPEWSLKKTETLTLIKNTLERRDSWQGKSEVGGRKSEPLNLEP